jgi:hypothetical protein
MRPIALLASEAVKSTSTVASADLGGVRNLLMTASVLALVVLLVLTALSIYKPRGMTRYGWRKQRTLLSGGDRRNPGGLRTGRG